MTSSPQRTTGAYLNRAWGIGATHALYREDGRWYHQLARFPGAFCDANGYVLFRSRAEYEACPELARGVEVNVRGGISAIRGYVRIK